MTIRDPEGDRFKAVEAGWRQTIGRDQWMVVRVDGRAFHSYTRRCERPFDPAVTAAMQTMLAGLCAEVSGSVVGYCQSDEASVVARCASQNSEHWFGGVVQKVASVAASTATVLFNQAALGLPAGAVFDGRVFPLPDPQTVADYLCWRRADARRNAVSMVCHATIGKKAVLNRPTSERVRMLEAAGIDLAGYAPADMCGTLARKHTTVGPVTYTRKDTGAVETTVAERSEWVLEPVEWRWAFHHLLDVPTPEAVV